MFTLNLGILARGEHPPSHVGQGPWCCCGVVFGLVLLRHYSVSCIELSNVPSCSHILPVITIFGLHIQYIYKSGYTK